MNPNLLGSPHPISWPEAEENWPECSVEWDLLGIMDPVELRATAEGMLVAFTCVTAIFDGERMIGNQVMRTWDATDRRWMEFSE